MSKVEYYLEEKYLPAILMYLLEHDNVHSTSFKDISSHYKNVVNKAEKLESKGLIKVEHQTKPFVKLTFRLTEKGERIAKDLKKIEEDLREQMEE